MKDNLQEIKDWGITTNAATRERVEELELPTAEEILEEIENE